VNSFTTIKLNWIISKRAYGPTPKQHGSMRTWMSCGGPVAFRALPGQTRAWSEQAESSIHVNQEDARGSKESPASYSKLSASRRAVRSRFKKVVIQFEITISEVLSVLMEVLLQKGMFSGNL
jgi:hypothetical protein